VRGPVGIAVKCEKTWVSNPVHLKAAVFWGKDIDVKDVQGKKQLCLLASAACLSGWG